jgi:hypothetical protein
MKAKRKTKPKPASAVPATAAELARILGVSRQLISAHQKDPDAPPIGDVDGWTAYLAAHGREQSGPPELRAQIGAQRLALLTAIRHREELKLSRERCEMLDKAEVQAAILKGTAVFFSALDRLAGMELPAQLRGLDEAGIAQRLAAAVEQLKAMLRDGLAKLANDAAAPANPISNRANVSPVGGC